MRRVWVTKAGRPDVLEVREEPDPSPRSGEVRIRVRAAGINFADLMARMGLYPDAPKIPCVLGYEVSGEIDAVGEGVTDRRVGQRVFGVPKFGGYTDTLVVPAVQTFVMPEAMTFEEGAALPVVYLTAHHLMLFTGNLRPGSTVLIHSAAGGVGIAATQLARTRDCVVIGTASRGKHDFLRSIGVDHPIDSAAGYVRAVRAIVGDRGVDLVLDPVGGPSWRDGYRLLAPAGRLVAFGLSAAASGTERNLLHAVGQMVRIPRFNPVSLMADNKTVSGANMGRLFDHPELLAPQFEQLLQMYDAGSIRPVVDSSFPFAEAGRAHQHLHDRHAIGKVLLVP